MLCGHGLVLQCAMWAWACIAVCYVVMGLYCCGHGLVLLCAMWAWASIAVSYVGMG